MSLRNRLMALVAACTLAMAGVPVVARADEGDLNLPGGIVAGSEAEMEALSTYSDRENAGHEEEWTALGLFQYIADNTTPGSAEHEDAQMGIRILHGTDDEHGRDVASTIDFASEGNPVSLMNVKDALSYIDTYNQYRARENREEGTNLSTNVGTNCTMLAISIAQCSYSSNIMEHSTAFSVGENLAWGYDPESEIFSNPFQGWYEEEKAYYKGTKPMPAGCSWGHYLNIVDPDTEVTGFAYSTDAVYGTCHEQSFSWYYADVVYTTKEFRSKWFNRYYAAMRAEGMGVHFDDVPASHWGHWMVRRAVGMGFMNGYDKYSFGPDDNVTRGQVATILWNMEKQPSGSGKSFPDVAPGKYYSDAIAWASGVGVVNGFDNGKFGPDQNVTREQLAAMLRNYAKYKGLDMSGASKSSYASMADAGKVSAWAEESVGWCFAHKLLTGTSDGNIMPQGSATRAQVAKMVVMLSKLG